MNWDWLMGFIEGEGSFLVVVADYRSTSGRPVFLNRQTTPRFALSQKEKEILEKISCFFEECGIKSSIYFNKHTNVYMLDVSGQKRSHKFAKLLSDKKWCTVVKKRSFDRWCEALKMIKEEKHLSERDRFREFCRHINKRPS